MSTIHKSSGTKTMSEQEQRAQSLIEEITPSHADLLKMYEGSLEQLQKGLESHKRSPYKWSPEESDYQMLDCCLGTLPSGKETGVYYGLDMGGTNIRVLRAELTGRGGMTIDQIQHELRDIGICDEKPKGILDSKAGAAELFNVVADAIKTMIEKAGDTKAKEIPIGFTFSFGFTQPKLDVAILNHWSKGFETGNASDDPVEGRDVCQLTNLALARKGLPAKINCVLNDTTGTMIAAAADKPAELPPCLVGLIVGTGVNACYFDPNAYEYGYKGVVINAEMGGYNHYLKRCVADAILDFESVNTGRAILEKQVSGMYLPEVIRIMLQMVYQKDTPSKLWVPYSMDTADTAEIYCAEPTDYAKIGDTLSKYFDNKPTLGQVKIAKRIIDAVWDRSAKMIAVQVAALAKKTRRLQRAMGGVTVGVDGSLFTKLPKYQEAVKAALREILGDELANLIHFQVTSDGSGKGAACLAATVAIASN